MRTPSVEILEKINRLATKPGFPKLSAIERDLLKHYLRELYELVDSPQVATANGSKIESPAIPTFELSHKLEQAESLPSEEDAEKPVTENTIKEEPLDEAPSFQPKFQFLPKQLLKQREEIQGDEVLTAEPVQTDAKELNSLLNESATRHKEINDTMKNRVTEIRQKLASGSIRDLIDFNKKFAIVNDLFKGDIDAFSQAIHTIDTAEDYETAQRFMNASLVVNYSWSNSPQSAEMFFEVVRQRFGVE